MRFKANEDPLVFPEEFKCGMKEELEHTDVTGGDREMTKKIVLAHLKEDPHYYSKLDVTMKADYQVPLNKPKKDPLPDFPRFETDLNVRKKAEESSPKEDMKSTLGFIKHQDADRTRARQNQQKMTPAKAEEATCADCGKKLSTSLIEKAEEELGKDKIEEIKNQTIIDKFAEEEKAKPARFQAEPAEAGIMDGIKSTIKNLTSSPKPEPYVKPTPLTKSSIRKQVQRA